MMALSYAPRSQKDQGEIHGHLWQEILRKQLQTTQDHFNEVI